MRSLLLCTCLCGLLGCSRQTTSAAADHGPAVQNVSYPCGKGTGRGVLHRPAGEGPFPAVILVHGDAGLTDWVKAQGRRLAERGYVTLAVELSPPARGVEEAHIMSSRLPDEEVEAKLKGAAAYLAGRDDIRAGAMGIIGWDLGGGYALDAALKDPQLRAVVVCYGRLVTDARLLAPLKGSVLGIFGARDAGYSAETIDQFRAAMAAAGKRVAAIHVYPKCGHGFMDPSDPGATGAACAEAAADAWDKIETYFARELAPR